MNRWVGGLGALLAVEETCGDRSREKEEGVRSLECQAKESRCVLWALWNPACWWRHSGSVDRAVAWVPRKECGAGSFVGREWAENEGTRRP